MKGIKQCPFCWSREQDYENLGKVWHIYCINCGAIGPDSKDKPGARAKWNQRGNIDKDGKVIE